MRGGRTAISLRALQAMARNLECTLRRTPHGELRVNWIGADEATAYYADDDLDALQTMEDMKRGLEHSRSIAR